MASLFCRTHRCGFNAFYWMSKFNSVPKIWPIQFLGSWLLYRKRRGHFWWFFHYFSLQNLQYWCWKHQNCQKDADHGYNHKKVLKVTFFENFGQNWANFDKTCHFLQKYDLFKIIFCVLTWARMKLEEWNLVNLCRKKLQKTYRKRNFEFLIFF